MQSRTPLSALVAATLVASSLAAVAQGQQQGGRGQQGGQQDGTGTSVGQAKGAGNGICGGNLMTVEECNQYREQMQLRAKEKGVPAEVTVE